MKKLLFLLAICSLFSSCKEQKFNSKATPTLRLVFETPCNNLEEGQAQVNAMMQRIEAAPLEVVIHSLENGKDGKEITVNAAKVADVNTLKQVLQTNMDLRFWDVFEMRDAEMQNMLQNIAKDSLLQGKIELNSGMMPLAVIGIVAAQNRAAIEATLANMDVPKNAHPAWGTYDASHLGEHDTKYYALYLLKEPRNRADMLDNSNITEAEAAPNSYNGNIEINLSFDMQGMKKFAAQTTRAAQDGNRSIAIVINDIVITAPRVSGPITGGRATVTGNFSIEEAQLLAQQLQFSALPCGNMKLVEETTLPKE